MGFSATLHAVEDAIAAGCHVSFARDKFLLRVHVTATHAHTGARVVSGHRYAIAAAATLKDKQDAWVETDEVRLEFGTDEEVTYSGVALAAVGAVQVDGIL